MKVKVISLIFNEMLNFFKRLIFFVIFCCIISCQPTVTYYDESRKPAAPPQYYRPSVPRSYDRFYQPNSRSYQNPYARPPANYYPYYDLDNYYIPPVEYNGYGQDNDFKGGGFDMNNIM